MKKFNFSFLISIFFIILFAGCNVADDINENILDIEDSDDSEYFQQYGVTEKIDKNDSKSNEDNIPINGSETNISVGDSIDANKTDVVNTITNPEMCGAGTHYDAEQNKCLPNIDANGTQVNCDEGFHLDNGQCVSDDYTPTVIDNEFNLSLPDFDNKKFAKITLGKNDEVIVVIRSTPKQTNLNNKLTFTQLTSNNVVTGELLFAGAPIVADNYDYKFKITSKNIAGKEEFQLTLQNSSFTDSINLDVEVVDQIALSGIRQKYTVVTNGDPQEIDIEATNVFGNKLQFEIVDMAEINDEGKLLITPKGSTIFPTTSYPDTTKGVKFVFNVTGLEDTTQDIEIKVKDLETGTTKSIWITVESARRNTDLYPDLYECKEEYNNKYYEETRDSNTPEDLQGVYSADNAIYLKSTLKMDYDIGNTYSTVMLFHPTNGQQYTYDIYGKEYIKNVETGEDIAIVYYAKHLQGLQYFIKYYDENKNTIVCEKRYFGYIDPINTQPNILEDLNVPELADKPNGPEGL